jgi:hypothetical protein
MNTKTKKIILLKLSLFAFIWFFSFQIVFAETCSEKHGICRVYYAGSDACQSDENPNPGLTGCQSGENCCVSTTPSTPAPTTTTGGAFDYIPMEKIPGFSVSGNFPEYILGVYKFGIWSVGIAALLMIMIGGFMYITSAGNNASMEKAKGIIFDSVIGILLALTAYLLLYVINPELVKIKTISGTLNLGSGGGGAGGSGGGGGSGKCEPVKTGPCSVDSLGANNCWSLSGANLSYISSLCNAESGGIEGRMSTVDKCSGTSTVFSCGALQVNLTCACKGQGAFTGREPSVGCANFSCTGAGAGYQTCVNRFCYGNENLTAACNLYKEHAGNKYSTWSKNTECKFN